jgi:hypothetical protein
MGLEEVNYNLLFIGAHDYSHALKTGGCSTLGGTRADFCRSVSMITALFPSQEGKQPQSDYYTTRVQNKHISEPLIMSNPEGITHTQTETDI